MSEPKLSPKDELVIVVGRMRKYQKAFYRPMDQGGRNRHDLRQAMKYERETDELLAVIEGRTREPVLFDDPPENADELERQRRDLRAAAMRWIDNNPSTMAAIETAALKMADEEKAFGIALLVERARWEYENVNRDTDFKINNNHRAYIMRWLVHKHPALRPWVTMRETRS